LGCGLAQQWHQVLKSWLPISSYGCISLTMEHSIPLYCALCAIRFDSDPSKVKNPDNRLPLICSTFGCWKTICFQCISRIRKGYILWKYISDEIECPHCKQYGFNIREPIVCRALCDIIQRIEMAQEDQAETEGTSVVSLSPPSVFEPRNRVSGGARISSMLPVDQNYQEPPVLGPSNPLSTDASTASYHGTEYQETNSPKKPTKKVKYNGKQDRVITYTDTSNKRKRFAGKGQEMENEKGHERWVPRYEIGTRIRRVRRSVSVLSYNITSKFY